MESQENMPIIPTKPTDKVRHYQNELQTMFVNSKLSFPEFYKAVISALRYNLFDYLNG